MVETDWIERETNPYDANRYNPEKDNDECLVCGSEFVGEYYIQSGGYEMCPECDVIVMYLD